jgi:hypothetical protein
VLDGSGATDGAVADEAGGLVLELVREVVEGVLECTGERVVVLGHDEDVAVELVDLRDPAFVTSFSDGAIRGGNASSHTGSLKSAMSTTSNSASVRASAMDFAQLAMFRLWRPERTLPVTMAIFVKISPQVWGALVSQLHVNA